VIIREVFANAHDEAHLDAVLAHFAPDAVWDGTLMGQLVVQGWEGIAGFLRDRWSTWEEHDHDVQEITDAPYEELDFTVEQVRNLGNEVVFGVVHEQARLRGGSGVIPGHVAFVWEFRDGLIVRSPPTATSTGGVQVPNGLPRSGSMAMSAENVESVKEVLDAFNRRSFSQISTYREGRVVFVESFFDHDEALKAVGLRE
jgi:ketosteroid isomerase-like protein